MPFISFIIPRELLDIDNSLILNREIILAFSIDHDYIAPDDTDFHILAVERKNISPSDLKIKDNVLFKSNFDTERYSEGDIYNDIPVFHNNVDFVMPIGRVDLMEFEDDIVKLIIRIPKDIDTIYGNTDNIVKSFSVIDNLFVSISINGIHDIESLNIETSILESTNNTKIIAVYISYHHNPKRVFDIATCSPLVLSGRYYNEIINNIDSKS